MSQTAIPCTLLWGETSKGSYFLAMILDHRDIGCATPVSGAAGAVCGNWS